MCSRAASRMRYARDTRAWLSLGAKMNEVMRRGVSVCSVKSFRVAIHAKSKRPRATTGKPSPWPMSSVCVLSTRIVMATWPSCWRKSVPDKPASIGSPPRRCTAKWRCERSERTREHRQRQPPADDANDRAAEHELECPHSVSQRGGDGADQDQQGQRIGNGGWRQSHQRHGQDADDSRRHAPHRGLHPRHLSDAIEYRKD